MSNQMNPLPIVMIIISTLIGWLINGVTGAVYGALAYCIFTIFISFLFVFRILK